MHDLGPGDVRIIRQLVHRFEARVARRWRDGRVLLAGDAAHTPRAAVPRRPSGRLVVPAPGRNSRGDRGGVGWAQRVGAAYLGVADALTARGLACLLVEGPGQGEPRLLDGLYLDEHVADGFARFLDAVGDDPRLGEAVGVQGNSFGGLFVARLAAQDPRVGACIVNGAPAVPELPPFRTARDQIAAAIGTRDEHRLTTVLDRLRFDPARHRIDCPVLVLHGGADPLVPDPAIQRPFAAGPRGELRIWADGEHTLYNHAGERDALTSDWFADQLAATGPVDAQRNQELRRTSGNRDHRRPNPHVSPAA